jgi:hypothetical protein
MVVVNPSNKKIVMRFVELYGAWLIYVVSWKHMNMIMGRAIGN